MYGELRVGASAVHVWVWMMWMMALLVARERGVAGAYGDLERSGIRSTSIR